MRLEPACLRIALAAPAVLVAPPAAAAPVGPPHLVANGGDVSGSLLDYFSEFGGPSGVKEIDVPGTITKTFGAPSLVGETLSFRSSQPPLASSARLTVGETTLENDEVEDGLGDYDYDPFVDGLGDLNVNIFVLPPIVGDGVNADDPTLPDFLYGGAFAEFGPRTAEYPDLELLLSIFVDGPLPTKLFEKRDPDTDELLYSEEYIEGPLPISRLTLGLVGGEPLPVPAPIPLPGGLPLLAGGLGLLALRRRLGT